MILICLLLLIWSRVLEMNLIIASKVLCYVRTSVHLLRCKNLTHKN